MSETLRRRFAATTSHQQAFLADPANLAAFDRLVDLLHQALGRGGRLLVCGNGGSMADAMHFAAEWSGRFRSDRQPYPAMALSDPVALTALANDFGFDEVFARQVEAKGQAGDLLLLISTSGDSPNLVRAAECARKNGIASVGLLGRGGGKLLSQVELPILVPQAQSADEVQEIHIQILHAAVEAVEERLRTSKSGACQASD